MKHNLKVVSIHVTEYLLCKKCCLLECCTVHLFACLVYSFTLTIEAVCPSEMLINLYMNTRHNYLETSVIHNHRHQTLKSHCVPYQCGLNSVAEWNIKINEDKTQAIYFSHRNRPPGSLLTLNGRNIPFVNNVKYLGVIFDRKITWKLHIKTIKTEAFRAFIRTVV
jgi:hypothetical protein